MKFLLEADDKKSPGMKTSADRIDDAITWLKSLSNYKTLKPAQAKIAEVLKESNYNHEFVNWVKNINNVKLSEEVAEMVGYLLTNDKIQSAQEKWLYDADIYNRPIYDTIYTLKALAFITNPSLQQNKETGENKYFDKPITLNDVKENGKIMSADSIRRVLNSRQTKGQEETKELQKQTDKEKTDASGNNALISQDQKVQDAIKMVKETKASFIKKQPTDEDFIKIINSINIDQKDTVDDVFSKILSKVVSGDY